ncbi:Endothelin-converting enzyme-like 1 [Seminavis robusta]|uniref:Endothelin-converting enzyme-like 1 n=1 Tax=Seminavis robusta TaxID=568900 RepID=A0A9N8HJ99_9STRA|nr:Endothelin-converting enzyme-like 1 [Seminavis robusta]|eukprot:Sro647_g180880.1 Endothelin-converting enzyme-like 1 (730) ;mRNA; r:17897-20380
MTSREPYKCPCCNNPWAAATGEFFAKLCEPCQETNQKNEAISRENMDPNTLPSSNFFKYSNGTWLEKNPIPPEYPQWDTFVSLTAQSQENLKNLLEELRAKKTNGTCTEEEAKVAAFFDAAMDEDEIEKQGVKPLAPIMALIDQAVAAQTSGQKEELAKTFGTLSMEYGLSVFFGIGVSPDNANTDHSLLEVCQGGIGLPDRDYYFDEDKQDKRDAYQKALALMLTLLLVDATATEPTEEMTLAAQKVYQVELKLAEKHMTRTENRDPHDTYNKMSVADFIQSTGDGSFDFGAFFAAATGKSVADLGDINIRNVEALKRVAQVVSEMEPETLGYYMKWRTVRSYSPYLPKAFVQAHFDFFQTTLAGTKEIKPRWKRAMAFTEGALGEALGKLYCAKYFDATSKERAVNIVEQVRQALEARLKEVDWMTADSTREQALKKMGRFGVKIGYPDKWTDYSTVKIDASSMTFLDMVFAGEKFDRLQDVKEMNAPTDKDKWFMTPQTINAVSIELSQASLTKDQVSAPSHLTLFSNACGFVIPESLNGRIEFTSVDADDAVNFGGMGAVIGHEMTHGFDDKGRKFDFAGTLTDWWTAEDAKEYESRVEVMVKQANSFQIHGQNVQGEMTSGENIADLGGLRLALRAMKAADGYDETALVDGFSPLQRFFLSWSQCWRQNITKERALQLLTIDYHGPNEMRCNGPLSNMQEFHAAFDVKEGDAMYVPVDQRVDIW